MRGTPKKKGEYTAGSNTNISERGKRKRRKR